MIVDKRWNELQHNKYKDIKTVNVPELYFVSLLFFKLNLDIKLIEGFLNRLY